jgi:hypothetical protein
MNWNSKWDFPTPPSWTNSSPESPPPTINPTLPNPWDTWTQDQVLMHWQKLKDDLVQFKADEMEFRKYVVSRAFPDAKEGTNTLELGGGYELKAQVKYNYKLADNDTVEAGLARIAKIGNEGSFIADRLVSWTPNFLKSEYNNVLAAADSGSGEARAIMKEINTFLTIDDAAPVVDIKEPKKGKKK